MALLEKNNIYSITEPTFEPLLRTLEELKPSQILVLTDANSHKHCYPKLKKCLPKHYTYSITPGEEHKTLDTCTGIWARMTALELDRKAVVINLGGGVLGDMGGFCASTYKRGIRFIQMPTTLLAMVDASVGGKLGIDFQGLKNHIGVFNLPEKVFLYPPFLETLDRREVRSGYAEIIKHGLIQDTHLWETCRQMPYSTIVHKHTDWTDLIRISVEIKAKVVEQDPTEKGLRKILNFGHTLGHAIETHLLNTNRKVLHGEAIAAGMIAEAWLSRQMGYIDVDDLAAITSYLTTIYDPLPLKTDELGAVIALTKQDKKNSHGAVRYALLQAIGNCRYDMEPPQALIRKSLAYYLDVAS